MADFLAWSHSRRKTYLDCPKQLYHTAVARKGTAEHVPYVESKAQREGKEIDDALTARLGYNNTPLPDKFSQWEPLCTTILASPGQKFTQMKIAFDQSFKICGYMDWDTTWLRAIYDFAIVQPPHAFIWDWKNGQIWPDDDQLKLFAATGFLAWPEVDTIDTSLVWLKHGITSDRQYRRRELPNMWNDLLPDVERMQVSYKTNHWPADPKNGKRTCGWCPVNRAGKCDRAAGPYKGS